MRVRTLVCAGAIAGVGLALSAGHAIAQDPEPHATAVELRESLADRAVERGESRQSERAVERQAPSERAPREAAPPPAAVSRPLPETRAPENRVAPRFRDSDGDERGRYGEGRVVERAEGAGDSAGSTGRTVISAPEAAGAQEQRGQAVPRGASRPRGGRPPVGTAVPRTGPAPQPRDRGRVYGGRVDRGGVYGAPRYYPRYSYPRYYYPRRYYPYGYGGFGLGFYYYDPYAWYGYDRYYYGGYGGYGYYGPRYGWYDRYDEGELRLEVRPRHAEVYVDGYYVGIVDDFDGVFQGLKLEDGPHRIEIVAPGFERIEFDVRIEAGRRIKYRADLRPRP